MIDFGLTARAMLPHKVERLQADYGEELDAFDKILPEERALLETCIAAAATLVNTAAVSTGGLQGKVAKNQLRSIGDCFLTDK